MFTRLSRLYLEAPDLWEHSLRVSGLASLVIREVNLNPDQKLDILVAGLLHDLGKTTWPKEWFIKPRHAISDSDWNLMQAHPIQSVYICQKLGLQITNQTEKLILCHHDIPGNKGQSDLIEPDLSTLILSACDVYAACTENRPYREKPFTRKQALQQVELFAPGNTIDIIQKCTSYIS